MSTRIQVIVTEHDRESFRARAARDGVSLSTWLREAGWRRLHQDTEGPLRSVVDLDRFFASIPDDPGREPDWEEHRLVIEKSKGSGHSGT